MEVVLERTTMVKSVVVSATKDGHRADKEIDRFVFLKLVIINIYQIIVLQNMQNLIIDSKDKFDFRLNVAQNPFFTKFDVYLKNVISLKVF